MLVVDVSYPSPWLRRSEDMVARRRVHRTPRQSKDWQQAPELVSSASLGTLRPRWRTDDPGAVLLSSGVDKRCPGGSTHGLTSLTKRAGESAHGEKAATGVDRR